MTSLPETVLQDTDWLLLSGNNLGFLNKAPDYLNRITLLNLSPSNLIDTDETVMRMIIKNTRNMDIRGNKLKSVPRIIVHSRNNSKLWISGNRYECNCDMLWFKDWLMNNPSVQDKENVTCSTDKLKGSFFLNNQV